MIWTSFGSSWQTDLACRRPGVKLETLPLQGAGMEEAAMHRAVGMSVKLVSKPREEAVRGRHHVEGSRSQVKELISMGKERERTSRKGVDIYGETIMEACVITNLYGDGM